MAYVRIATPEEVGGALGKRWREALDKGDRIANITTSSSLRPSLVETFFAHYRNLMNSPDSGLTPAERQMVATVTANAFRCQY